MNGSQPGKKRLTTSTLHRKTNKPMMEKRRRERINTCLDQLKAFLMDAVKKESSYYSKLEKADILELTVKYLMNLRGTSAAGGASVSSPSLNKYLAGFSECTLRVGEYLASVDSMNEEARACVLGHLANSMSTTSAGAALANDSSGAALANGSSDAILENGSTERTMANCFSSAVLTNDLGDAALANGTSGATQANGSRGAALTNDLSQTRFGAIRSNGSNEADLGRALPKCLNETGCSAALASGFKYKNTGSTRQNNHTEAADGCITVNTESNAGCDANLANRRKRLRYRAALANGHDCITTASATTTKAELYAFPSASSKSTSPCVVNYSQARRFSYSDDLELNHSRSEIPDDNSYCNPNSSTPTTLFPAEFLNKFSQAETSDVALSAVSETEGDQINLEGSDLHSKHARSDLSGREVGLNLGNHQGHMRIVPAKLPSGQIILVLVGPQRDISTKSGSEFQSKFPEELVGKGNFASLPSVSIAAVASGCFQNKRGGLVDNSEREESRSFDVSSSTSGHVSDEFYEIGDEVEFDSQLKIYSEVAPSSFETSEQYNGAEFSSKCMTYDFSKIRKMGYNSEKFRAKDTVDRGQAFEDNGCTNEAVRDWSTNSQHVDYRPDCSQSSSFNVMDISRCFSQCDHVKSDRFREFELQKATVAASNKLLASTVQQNESQAVFRSGGPENNTDRIKNGDLNNNCNALMWRPW